MDLPESEFFIYIPSNIAHFWIVLKQKYRNKLKA